MTTLAPSERAHALSLLRDHRRHVARVNERIERTLDDPLPAAPRKPVALVRAAGDEQTKHVAYRTARGTLCGLRVARLLRARGQHSTSDCETCRRTLHSLRELDMVEQRST